jgi:CheY-like chemotaxis protein
MACNRLGGVLRVKSYLGAGTEIYFEIPLQPEDIVVAEEREEADKEETPSSQPKKISRILLVDDVPLVLEVQKDMLASKRGHTDLDLEVFTASDALGGVFILLTQQIDVLFADYHMGKQSGLDMIRRFQQTRPPGGSPVKLYLLTGGIDQETIREAQDLGVKVLVKPVSHSQMMDAIKG